MVKSKIMAIVINDKVLTEDSDAARELYIKSVFGKPIENKIQLSLIEAAFLLEKGRLDILDGKNRSYEFERFLKLAKRHEPNFWVRYRVYSDLRNRGYVVKTALKFGADFRVYDRGIKPGEDHAKWVAFPVSEGSTLTWHEFSAKNRVAHSTKKRLLICVVDDEGDVTYYEIRWKKP
ncbi:tRNA-intron lyase [Candidatus Woesearchaeota archaeon]|nr:MAG: tRNA-intron lyase [Candidatus Woesearchaeota archaeon]